MAKRKPRNKQSDPKTHDMTGRTPMHKAGYCEEQRSKGRFKKARAVEAQMKRDGMDRHGASTRSVSVPELPPDMRGKAMGGRR